MNDLSGTPAILVGASRAWAAAWPRPWPARRAAPDDYVPQAGQVTTEIAGAAVAELARTDTAADPAYTCALSGSHQTRRVDSARA